MALVGQGDPRWIVQNREDGKNVNNWHWTETDFTSWAKNRLTELLVGTEFETSTGKTKIESLTMSGEVSVNTRKQKTIFFYELDVTLKWEGTLVSDGSEIKGTIQLPYISEENDDDDFEVKLTVENENKERSKAKDELRSKVIPFLKEKIPQMLTEMRQEGSSKTALPVKQAPTAIKFDTVTDATTSPTTPASTPQTTPTPTPTPTATAASKASATPVTATTTSSSSKKSVSTTSFTLKEKFMCSPADLYACLVDPGRVKAYAGGDAEISGQVGGKFKLFSGYVSGEFVELESPKKIVQKWRFNTWPEGHYSTVKIEIEEKENKAVLTLTQTGVPDSDKEHTEGGWKSNFWSRIKGIFGYGAAF